VAGGGPHARKLVGGDAHADARAANQNAAIHLPAGDLLADDRRHVGIIDALGAEAANVLDLMP
jgi:hypothetical protein